MRSIVEPLLIKGSWVQGKIDQSGTNSLKFSLHEAAGFKIKTKFDDFSISYLEEWAFTGTRIKNEDVWHLEKAHFSLFKSNQLSADYEEIILLHCWEGFVPTAGPTTTKAGLEKQEMQEKYQRSIHMHLKFLNSDVSKFIYLAKSHLAVSLGRDTYEFTTIDGLSKAMGQAVQLLNDEVLEEFV